MCERLTCIHSLAETGAAQAGALGFNLKKNETAAPAQTQRSARKEICPHCIALAQVFGKDNHRNDCHAKELTPEDGDRLRRHCAFISGYVLTCGCHAAIFCLILKLRSYS